MEQSIEERLLSVERRLEALLHSLSDEHKKRFAKWTGREVPDWFV